MGLNGLCWWVAAVSQSVVGLAVVVLLLPLVVPVLMVLWTWRCLVLLMVQAIYGGGVYVASGMEALFTLDSCSARAVISGVAVLRGKISVAAVRKFLAERITDARDDRGRFRHPNFRQVVEKRCGVVVWIPENNFHVDKHVSELQLDCRPRLLQDEDDLLSEMSARTNLPFPRGLARWEVLVAPLKRFGTDKENIGEWQHTAVIVRLHHAHGDGRSIMALIVSALEDAYIPEHVSFPVSSPCSSGNIYRAARFLWSVTHLPWVVVRVLTRGDASSLHGCRLAGSKLLAWSPPISLAALKKGRALAGVSVNDLLLTGLAEALYRYFKDEGVEVPVKVMTAIPVDVTAPGRPAFLSNRISLCTVALPTYKMTKMSRLTTVHQRLSELKNSPDVMVNYLALSLIASLLPAPLARRALCTHGVTLVASNVPGPPEQIRLFGEPVDDMMFWSPNKSRTGLGVSILSYRGSIRLGLNVDSALISSRSLASQLLEHSVSEVIAILDLLMNPESTPEVTNSELHHESESYHSSSEMSEVVVTHSTDEYDDDRTGFGSLSYTDMHDSTDTRMIDDSITTFSSLENQLLLGGKESRSSLSRSLRSYTVVEKTFGHSDISLKMMDDSHFQDR